MTWWLREIIRRVVEWAMPELAYVRREIRRARVELAAIRHHVREVDAISLEHTRTLMGHERAVRKLVAELDFQGIREECGATFEALDKRLALVELHLMPPVTDEPVSATAQRALERALESMGKGGEA